MIPDTGDRTEWPPAWLRPAYRQMQDHLALWRGDTSVIDDYPRTAIHVPLPADIAAAHADLLFAEPPIAKVILDEPAPGEDDTITIERAKRREAQQALIDRVFNQPDVQSALLEGGEIASAAGGVFLRAAWDRDVTDRPMLEVVDPDAAVPTFRLGHLMSVQFWSDLTGPDGRYRLVEEHRPGAIEYALFRGDRTLGRRVPLTELEETAHLARIVNADSIIPTGTDLLTACYVPNLRPSKAWRRTPLAPYGRSDFEGLTDLFTQADIVLGSWMRDIRLARGRLTIATDLLNPLGGGRGTAFDEDREVFVGLDGADPDSGIHLSQFAIRVAEHRDTLAELTDLILRRAGLSQSTFGEQEGIETATGVKAKQQHSTRTRAKKIIHWRPALAHMARVLAHLDTTIFGADPLDPTALIDIRFPAETQVDLEQAARTAQTMRNAESASIATRVRLLHPAWDSPTVNEEVAQIERELGIGTAPTPDTWDG